jgi:ADP-heptose:LPS heptosyltransferase
LFLPTEEALQQKAHDYDLAINMHDSEEARHYLSSFDAQKIPPPPDDHTQPVTQKLLHYFSAYFKCSLPEYFDYNYDLYPQPTHHQHVEEWLQQCQPHDKLIGIHLGCHGLSKARTRFWNRFAHGKAWPLKNYIALAQKLQKQIPDARIVLTGSKEEVRLGERFCKKVPQVINLIHRTSVLDLAALMPRLKLLISNDTGVLHVACASTVPLIALFGKSNPLVTGPYPPRDNRIVLHQPCISKISVTTVLACIFKLMG